MSQKRTSLSHPEAIDRPRRWRRFLLMALAVAVVVAVLFAFRTQTYQDYVNGELVLTWRWGALRRGSIDFDRDGQVDLVLLYRWSWTRPHAHTIPREALERHLCRNSLDLRIVYAIDGSPTVLELDSDCDGVREKRVTGDDLSEELGKLREKGVFGPSGRKLQVGGR